MPYPVSFSSDTVVSVGSGLMWVLMLLPSDVWLGFALPDSLKDPCLKALSEAHIYQPFKRDAVLCYNGLLRLKSSFSSIGILKGAQNPPVQVKEVQFAAEHWGENGEADTKEKGRSGFTCLGSAVAQHRSG